MRSLILHFLSLHLSYDAFPLHKLCTPVCLANDTMYERIVTHKIIKYYNHAGRIQPQFIT